MQSNALFDVAAPDRSIWRLIWQSHRVDFVKVIGFNLFNALVGVATIAFINHDLLSGKSMVIICIKINANWYFTFLTLY